MRKTYHNSPFVLTGSVYYAPDNDDAGGGTSTVDVEGAKDLKGFNEKFSARRPGVKLPADVALPPAVQEDQKAAAEREEAEKRIQSQKKIDESRQPVKKAGSNVPHILDEKRKAEAERDELQKKLDAFEKTDKVALEAKIADLEKKLSEGGNTKEETATFKKRLEETEAKLAEREKTLVNETERLQSKLSFYDIQEDPAFIEKFVQPIKDAYAEAVDSFAGDAAKSQLLRRALLANSQALSATNAEERVAAEKERNTILSQIKESMDDFSAGQFHQAMGSYIRSTITHAKALQKHQETTTELRKKRDEIAMTERTKVFDTWSRQFDYTAPEFDEQAKVGDDLAEAIKELKLDPDSKVKEATAVAKRVMIGKATPEESIDLIHKGRIYPSLVAKLQAKDKVITDLRSTIEKLKNAGTKGGATGSGGGTGGAGQQQEEKKDLAAHNKRFSASRFQGNLPVARTTEQ